MRDFPNAKVLAWLDLQPPASIWITTVTLMESRFGLFRMPARKRRDHRLKELELILAEDIERRFAPFDEAAALSTALLLAERQLKGRPIEYRDAMIAGIAISTKATLATRNVAHFSDLGTNLVNPWD
jgi:predicted nucleic acid-binding protein